MELTITSSSYCIIISLVKVLLKVPPILKQSLFRLYIYIYIEREREQIYFTFPNF
jgi:hypothetical protein